jgi:hypothetical protein
MKKNAGFVSNWKGDNMAESLIERFIALRARQQGIDPAYALAVARQESGMNPTAVGDQGRSLGLFQVQAGAAQDAGIDPALRGQTVPNIDAGVTYLRQSLDRAGGNPALALEMYNKGPALQGRGDPQYVSHVDQQYAQVMQERDRAAMEDRLRAIQQRRQQLQGVPSPPASSTPPLPPSLPSGAPKEGYLGPQDVGEGQTATVLLETITDPRINQAKPTNIPLIVPGISPEEIRRLAAGHPPTPDTYERAIQHALGRIQAGAQLQAYSDIPSAVAAAKQESAARGQPPSAPATPSDIVLDITKPSAPSVPQATPAPPQGGGPFAWLPGFEFMHALPAEQQAKVAEVAQEAVQRAPAMALETAGSMGGAALGALAAPHTFGLVNPISASLLGGSLAHRATQYLPEPFRPAPETPLATSPIANVYPSDVFSAGVTLGAPLLGRAGKFVVRHLRAGRALSAAEQATAQQAADYLATYQQAEKAVQDKWATGEARKSLQWAEKVSRAQMDAEDKWRLAEEAFHTKKTAAYHDALREAKASQAAYKEALADYRAAVPAHQAAVHRAQALPEAYMPPEIPGHAGQPTSHVLYNQLAESAGDTPIDMLPAQQVALTVQEQLGVSVPSMQPSRIQRIINDIHDLGNTASFAQVHQLLKDLGPLTRSTDGKTRGAAKQLFAGLTNETRQAGPLAETLRQANAAWRKEETLHEFQRQILRPGGTVLNYNAQGELTLNPRNLLNATERFLARDPFAAGSFSPAELAAFRRDIRSFIATPPMPSGTPLLPGPITVKNVPTPVREPPAAIEPPRYTFPPVAAPFTPPPPVEPTITPPSFGRLAMDVGKGVLAGVPFGGSTALKLGTGYAVADLFEYMVSRALLNPQLRPLVLQAIRPNGTLDPALFGTLATLMHVTTTDFPEPGAPGVPQSETDLQRFNRGRGAPTSDLQGGSTR